MSDGFVSVRDAARLRRPLGVADVQALEGALSQADLECGHLRAQVSALEARLARLEGRKVNPQELRAMDRF